MFVVSHVYISLTVYTLDLPWALINCWALTLLLGNTFIKQIVSYVLYQPDPTSRPALPIICNSFNKNYKIDDAKSVSRFI